MIILTDKTSKVSFYKIADSGSVYLNPDNIIINESEFIYGRTKDNVVVYKGVTNTPSDWDWDKYKYDGTTWSANSDYNEPTRGFLESLGDPQPPTL
mgnify:CR=1 FL=1